MAEATQAGTRARDTRLVLGIALAARLAVAAYAVLGFPSNWFYTRGLEMGFLGDSLAHGAGLSSPFGPPTGPTAMIAPGYPILVAGVFRLLGSYTRTAELVLMGFNIALNVLTVWLILRIGRRLAGEGAAVCAAMFWACSLPLLWMPTIFWETSASTFLLLWFVEIALLLRDGGNALLWAAAGVCCGVAGLLNPALLPSLLALAAWAVWMGRRSARWRNTSLLLGTLLVVYSAWPIRNARVFHAWIPTRTTVGLELWMGNRSGSEGFLDQSVFPTYNQAELAAYRTLGEVKYTNRKSELALDYIRTHPAAFLRLTLLRFLRFWIGSGSRGGSPFFILHAVLTLLLGGLGAVCLLRSSDRGMAPALLLPLLLFPLPYYVTHAEFRYRLVVDPLLTALSAMALEKVFCRWPAHREVQRTRLNRMADAGTLAGSRWDVAQKNRANELGWPFTRGSAARSGQSLLEPLRWGIKRARSG